MDVGLNFLHELESLTSSIYVSMERNELITLSFIILLLLIQFPQYLIFFIFYEF